MTEPTKKNSEVMFALAALFHAARIVNFDDASPIIAFNKAEAFITEAEARGIRVPGDDE
jgi:hypothetical protein